MSLLVDIGVGINPLFLNYNTIEKKIIINLGLAAYEELNSKIFSIFHQQKYDKILEEQKKQLNKEVSNISEEHEREIKLLNERIECLQSKISNHQYIIDEKENMYKNIITNHFKEQNNLQSLLENTLKTFTNNSSSQKGKMGEIKIERIIENYFPEYEIINVSKKPHQGDFHIKNKHNYILIEIKNYDSEKIRTSQIEKLYYDIEYCQKENIQINSVMFMSLNQTITSKKNIDFEIYKNIPIIYLSNVSQDYDKISLAISLLEKYQQITKINNNDQQSYLIHFMNNKINSISISIDNLDQQYKIILDIYTYIKQKYEKYTKEHNKNINHIKQILNEIQEKVQHQQIDYEVIEDNFLNIQDPSDISKNMLKTIQEKYLEHKIMIKQKNLNYKDIEEDKINIKIEKEIWMNEFSWIEIIDKENVRCNVCCYTFSGNHKKYRFLKHQNSIKHKKNSIKN